MKENIIIKVLILFSILETGCTDQEFNASSTYIINNSGKLVTLNFYSNGILNEKLTVAFNELERRKVYSDGSEGKAKINYYPGVLYLADSVIVAFGTNDKRAIHYSFARQGNNLNALSFDDIRNYFNPKNYDEKVISESRKKIKMEYTFTFTEQDYQNAK